MPFPLAAIPAAISVGSALYGALRGGSRPGADERRYRNMFDSTVYGLGQRADGMSDRFERDLESFDPEPYFAQATEANLNAYDDDFARSYASGLGRMVGQGRTPSYNGLGLRDAQQTIRQGQQDRARIRQQGADNLAGARMNLLGMRGDYASGLSNRYLDAITGRANTLEAQRLEDNASRRRAWGQLAGGFGQIAGSMAGGGKV